MDQPVAVTSDTSKFKFLPRIVQDVKPSRSSALTTSNSDSSIVLEISKVERFKKLSCKLMVRLSDDFMSVLLTLITCIHGEENTLKLSIFVIIY